VWYISFFILFIIIDYLKEMGCSWFIYIQRLY
jgi:hypothetical protein